MKAHAPEPVHEFPAGAEVEFQADLDPRHDAAQASGQRQGLVCLGEIQGHYQIRFVLHGFPHCRRSVSRQASRYAGLVFSAR